MEKFYTQTFHMLGLQFIAIFFLLVFIIAGFLKDNIFFVFTLFSLFLFLLSFLFKYNKIFVDEKSIDVKVSFCKGIYFHEELKELIIQGNDLKYGKAIVDLKFIKNGSGKVFVVRTQSNIELIKKLLINFDGKISFMHYKNDFVKKQLISIGAKPNMFN